MIFPLPSIITLKDLQSHVHKICNHFKWDEVSNEKTFLLFIEEVGELAKAIRKLEQICLEKTKPVADIEVRQQELADEFADVFNYLIDLSNRFNVDLEKAYIKKMSENLNRQWI